jgi:hypothetical protein
VQGQATHYARTVVVKTPKNPLTDQELERNLRAVDNAVAQQTLEGLTVSTETIEDMRRAARGEIPAEEVIANIYARFKHVPITRP